MAENDSAAAPAAAESTSAPIEIPESMTVDQAVGILGKLREKPPATPATAGAAETESAPQGDDAAAATEQPPGEATEEVDPAEEPSVDAPKSWTKAEREAFKSLPREHQQAIAERERERETYYRKGHDEAAQRTKAAEAERQAAEQARQQYESALPNLLQTIQQNIAGEFADIKSVEDLRTMQTSDPMRFGAWQVAQYQLQQVQAEAQQVAARQQQEAQKNWAEFVQNERKALHDKAPEFADPQKAAKVQADARAMLNELGFSDDELGELWEGRRGLSLQDHRVQLALLDGIRFRNAKAQVKTAAPKPASPVQRPGSPVLKGQASTEAIQAQQKKLATTGSIEDAVRLLRLQRRA